MFKKIFCTTIVRKVFSVHEKMAYPNLKNKDQSLLKIRTKDNEIEELKFKTEKHDHEKFSNFSTINNDYHKEKYKSLKKRRQFYLFLNFY